MRVQRPQRLTTRPVVSVVIPCYNYGRYLVGCVAGVLAQGDVDLEVIIVDDCSTDGSQDIERAIAAAEPRVQLVLHETNQGHITTYNDGLSRVTGDYVVLLSADDLLAPGSLARSVALMEANPDVVLTYGHPVTFDDTPPPARERVSHWTVWEGQEWLRRVCKRGRNIILNPEAVLRRSLMGDVIAYEGSHPHAADMKLWMRAATRGDVGRVNGSTQAYYRVHATNMHNTQFSGVLTDLRQVKRVFDSFFDEGHLPTALNQELRRVAHVALAKEARLHARVSQVGGDDRFGGTAAQFEALARDCDTDLRKPRTRQASNLVRFGGAGPFRRALRLRAYDVRWNLRWQRWRRFGT